MKFATAIIDPPWPYSQRKSRLTADGKVLTGFVRFRDSEADSQYKVLSIDDLKRLPVGEVVSGYVFLWATMPFLPAALDLLSAWGFEYKTGLCWGKWRDTPLFGKEGDGQGLTCPPNNKSKAGAYGGVGYWFLGNHELVLVGKKPGVKSIRTKRSSFFVYPKLAHSEKPTHIHELCEEAFPGPYLELFGRRARRGWTVLGNQAPGENGRDIFEALEAHK